MNVLISALAALLTLAGGFQEPGGETPPGLPFRSTVPTDTLVRVGSHSLHATVHRGEGDVAVVFEAGGGASASSWDSLPLVVSERLGITTVVYDRAGMGRSELGPPGLTPEDEVDDLQTLLTRLGVTRPVLLVGHSYGGALSMLYAARHAEQTAGLVLVDPMTPEFVGAMGMEWVTGTAPGIEAPTTDSEKAIVRMTRTFPQLIDQLRRSPVPEDIPVTVVTAGKGWWDADDANRAWRRSHEQFAANRAGVRLVVADSSGHDVPADQPELVLREIERLLARSSVPEAEVLREDNRCSKVMVAGNGTITPYFCRMSGPRFLRGLQLPMSRS